MKHCPPTVHSPEDLLLRFEQTGDALSFAEIVRRYSGMVYGVCYRVTRNAHDAEDATQAVFLKLATQARTTNGIPRVGPWLQQVAKTTSVDLRRSRTRRQNREQIRAAIVEQQDYSEDAPETASLDELKQRLREEVDRLPVTYRTPLILYYFGGLSTEQIAVELKSNAKALAVRLFRGRKMLGARLKERGIVTAGGAVVTLAVADAILGTLANSVFHLSGPGGAVVAGSGMAASASPWATSHTAIVNTLVDRVLSITRTCAMGAAAGKWKLSVFVLLSMGSAIAGTSDTIQESKLGKSVGGFLHEVGNLVRGGNGSLKSIGSGLRADAEVPAAQPAGGSEVPVQFGVPSQRVKPVVKPVAIAPLQNVSPARVGQQEAPRQSGGVSSNVVASGTPVGGRRAGMAARGATTDLVSSASGAVVAFNAARPGSSEAADASDERSASKENRDTQLAAAEHTPHVLEASSPRSHLSLTGKPMLGPVQVAGTGANAIGTLATADAGAPPAMASPMVPAVPTVPTVGEQVAAMAGSTGSATFKPAAPGSESSADAGSVAAGTGLASAGTNPDAMMTGPAGMGSAEGTGPVFESAYGSGLATGLTGIDTRLEYVSPTSGVDSSSAPASGRPVVPEPGMVGVAAIAAAGLLMRRRRRSTGI